MAPKREEWECPQVHQKRWSKFDERCRRDGVDPNEAVTNPLGHEAVSEPEEHEAPASK